MMFRIVFVLGVTIACLSGQPPAQSRKSGTHTAVTLPKKFNATGDVKCSVGGYALDKWCMFRVVRKSGAADIWVDIAPGKTGRYRLLHFAGKKFTASDGATTTWKRIDDNWLVTVAGSEFYFIPDALIFGG